MTPVDPNVPDRDPRDYRDRDPNRPVEPVRERIERRTIIREPRSGGGGAAFGVGALIVLLLVAIGAFLWWNSRHANPGGPGANPASNDMTTPTPGGGYGTGTATDNGAGSMTGNPSGGGAGSFGIAEGSFNDEQSAVNERQRLNSLTDQPVTMTQTTENGAPVYRVVIGNFATRAEADSSGRTLASTASLSNWKVVPIQP